MSSAHAVEAAGLVKRYGDTTALAGVDINVPTSAPTVPAKPRWCAS